MSNSVPTIETKKVGRNSCRLKLFSDKYVIFKQDISQGGEAEFGEKVGEFTDEKKAKAFFEKLKR